jgi:hypothetical protein
MSIGVSTLINNKIYYINFDVRKFTALQQIPEFKNVF